MTVVQYIDNWYEYRSYEELVFVHCIGCAGMSFCTYSEVPACA